MSSSENGIFEAHGSPPSLPAADALLYAFRRNVVVAASAGTGKTHRLTALYVLLALGLTSMGQRSPHVAAEPLLPERIWATTFTRAAAREIAERVHAALRGLAGPRVAGDGIPFLTEIQARFAEVGSVSEAEIGRRARRALDRWSSARIDTLHGLARRVVERHAIALGLPPALSILDEDEAARASADAVDRALTEGLRVGGEAADAARDLWMACGSVGAVRAQVARLLDRLDEEGVSAIELWRADHLALATAARDRLLGVVGAAASGASPVYRAPASALFPMLRSSDHGSLVPEAAFDPLVELFMGRQPRKKTPADEAWVAFRDDIGSEPLRARAERLFAWLRAAGALDAREARVARFVDGIARAGRADRAKRAGLGFGDLLRLARNGMRDKPEVAAAVRAEVGALLVDELQDTSRVQRDLVMLLREPLDRIAARAPGTLPSPMDIEESGLMIVGDRKQSIYGFRGADVAVFSEMCGALAGAPAAHALRLAPGPWPRAEDTRADFIALRESRRSGAAVLAFVNAFSERDFSEGRGEGVAAREFEVTYAPTEHLVAVHAERPRGAVVLIEDDGALPPNADALTREAEGPLREALVAAAWIDADLRKTGRKASDYALLARRRNTLPLVQTALDRLNVPYVVAGRALFDASEVRDVAALVRLALDPRDRHALATVLRGPMVALTDTALAAFSEPGRGLTVPMAGPLPEGAAVLSAEEMRRLQAFRSRFGALRQAALRAPPADAIAALVAGLDLDRVIAALPRPEARLANVDRLVAIAGERGGSLAAFSRWLDRRIEDESDEPEGVVFEDADNAVRLLTIHGSKGLDFPVVVVVDLAAEPRPQYPGIDVGPKTPERAASLVLRHFAPMPGPTQAGVPAPIPLQTPVLREAQAEARARDQAERRRITYVALTRAKDMLVLVSPPPRPTRGPSAWRTLSASLTSDDLNAITHRALAADLLERAQDRVTDLVTREAERRAAAALGIAPIAPHLTPGAETVRVVALPTTALGMFEGCQRRFRLRHLLGFDEPLATGQLDLFAPDVPPDDRDDRTDANDDRSAGRAAHRVLERWPHQRWGSPQDPGEIAHRLAEEGLAGHAGSTVALAESLACWLEGPYLAELACEGSAADRERRFAMELRRERGPSLVLRGAIDLVAFRSDQTIDVIDYKRSAPTKDLAAHAFQLRAYALAITKAHEDSRVRAGIAFLHGGRAGRGAPVWLGGEDGGYLSAAEHKRFEQRLLTLTASYAVARMTDHWEGQPADRCRKLGCGFIAACHAKSKPADGTRSA